MKLCVQLSTLPDSKVLFFLEKWEIIVNRVPPQRNTGVFPFWLFMVTSPPLDDSIIAPLVSACQDNKRQKIKNVRLHIYNEVYLYKGTKMKTMGRLVSGWVVRSHTPLDSQKCELINAKSAPINAKSGK